MKQGSSDDDDDFDYIYHLPTADPLRIIHRDPFKKEGSELKKKRNESMSQLSQSSHHSIQELRSVIDPSRRGFKTQRRSMASATGSNYSLVVDLDDQQQKMSRRSTKIHPMNSSLMPNDVGQDAMMPGLGRKTSFKGSSVNLNSTSKESTSGNSSKGRKRGALDIYAGHGAKDLIRGGSINGRPSAGSSVSAASQDPKNLMNMTNVETFEALPKWFTSVIRPRHVAIFALFAMTALVLEVLIMDATPTTSS